MRNEMKKAVGLLFFRKRLRIFLRFFLFKI